MRVYVNRGEKMKGVRIFFTILCFILFAGGLYAEKSQPNFQQSIQQKALPEVIEGRQTDICKYSLKNGIPVYYIKNTENEIDDVSIVVKGGRPYLKSEQAGLEKALFTMMCRGSKKYNYYKRLFMFYEKSASLFMNTMQDASVLSVECVNYYMDEMLPLLTDSFMNPVYPKKVYDNMITEFAQQIQSSQTEPRFLLETTIDEVAYKDHPYQASFNATKESLPNITIDAMKKWHKSILDSRRIFIVAVCSMDAEELVDKLNSTIGTIRALDTELPEIEINEINVSGKPIVIANSSSAGSGYAVRLIKTPSVNDKEYLASRLASIIYSDILYNLVRTKYGACYTPGNSLYHSKAGYGIEYLSMMSNFTDFTKYVKEARDIMALGKYIEKLNEDGSYVFSSVAEVLPGAKNSLINSIFSYSTNTNGRTYQYISDLVFYDDITASDAMIDKIHEVTVDEVLQVFKKYWVEQEGRWIAIVGPEYENVISFDE